MRPVSESGRAATLLKVAGGLGWALIGRRPVPLFTSLELTRRCNGHCAYCASPVMAGESELPTEGWVAIIDDIRRSGGVAVSLTGGEPLLRPDIGEICAHAVNAGLKVDLHTNGRLLGDHLGLLRLVSGVTVSLDSVPEVNDAARGDGAFEAAVEAVRLARSHGRKVKATAVLSSNSLPRLEEFLGVARDLNLPVMFQPVYSELLRSGGAPTPDLPSPSEMKKGAGLLTEEKSRGAPIINSRSGLRMLRQWPEQAGIKCMGGLLFVRVTSTGRMEICGLDCDPSPGGVDAGRGVVEGMKLIRDRVDTCRACWSMSRVEFNLACRLDPWAVVNIMSSL